MDKKNDINGKCSGYQKATKYPAYVTEWAIRAYDAYTAEVGGVNFKGEPLPSGKEFFADPAKAKQADGWRAAAAAVWHEVLDDITARSNATDNL